ncbi:SpaA isopeptide-forming pilin-related protein [Salinicoccus sesuvii]|uniref:SpaA isopeptide-forming pilin-related protein n=1 Tax=Salinicoccus sesuvii TaxID=868281 RepID=A0ABV7N4Q0_9STAP
MKIRKASSILLLLLLLHSTFLDSLVFAAQPPEGTDGTGLVEVEGHEENGIIAWHIKVNAHVKTYAEGNLNIQLEGGHVLAPGNISTIKDKVGTLEEKSDGTYSIALEDPSKVSNFILTTKITDQNTSNYILSIEASMDQDKISAAGVHYTKQSIEGTIKYINMPEDQAPESTTIHLIDTATSDTVETLEVPSNKSTFTFENIRKYNDNNSEILYKLETETLGNYYTSVEGTEIVHKYLEAEIEGTIANTAQAAFSIEVINDQTSAVVRTMDMESDAKKYKVEDLPLNDTQGNPIPYTIRPVVQEGLEITVKDNTIEVDDIETEESSEEPSKEISVEQPKDTPKEVQEESDNAETSGDEPVKLGGAVGSPEEDETTTEPVNEIQENLDASKVDTAEIDESESEADSPDNEKDKKELENEITEETTEEPKRNEESETTGDTKAEILEKKPGQNAENSKTQKFVLEETKLVDTETTTFSNLTQEYSFMPSMAFALGTISTSGERPLFPSCESTMALPFPGIANSQSNIERMGWQEHDLYRNRTPQPIKYEEGYLQKCATPNGGDHSYSINVSTQGSTTTTAQPLDIVMVLDNSGSMDDRYADGTTRWQRTRAGVVDFVKTMTEDNKNVRISIVSYSSDIISSSNLTNDTSRILSAIPQKNPGGATFTQLGLMEGERMLSLSPSSNKKAMIVLTDGVPTYSYEGTSVSTRWNPESIDSFNRRTIKGNGRDFQLGRERYGIYNSLLSMFFPTTITDHGQPTISQARLIQERNPELEIYTVGIDLGNASSGDASAADIDNLLAKIASDPAYAYKSVNPAKGLPATLKDIQKKISIDSFNNGKIIDPIGEMYDLNLGFNKVFDDSDYTLTASSSEIKNAAKVSYNPTTRTLSVTGINLGKNDWLNLNYNVVLRTDDPNFKMDTWYAMNGRTTVVPTRTSTRVLDYPVPEAKAVPKKYDFIFTKINENDRPLAGAKFQLKNSEGSVTAMATSGNDGVVIFPQMSIGEYVLMETSAPEGYQPDGIKYKVTIERDGTYIINGKSHDAQSFFVKNMPKLSKLKIINYTSSSEAKALPGAVFELRALDGKVISTGLSDKNGELTFSELRSGDYLLAMTKAPEGHSLNSEPVRITLNGQDVETVEIENTPQMLPETGGMGTIPFFAIGLFIVFFSLFSKNRLNIK